MASLTRWDPFREMNTMRNWMDRFWDESRFGAQGWGEGDSGFGLALDVAENDDSYRVKASIPGINPDDLEITINNNVLTIQGQTNQEQEKQDERYHLRERRFGSFRRSIVLPSAVDREQVEATCENGVLTLRLPKSEESKPRRININPGRTIEGQQSGAKAGNGGSSSQDWSRQESAVGKPGQPQIAPNDREASAGGTNRKSEPATDEQSSSAQTMEGIERPR
jgi:HSP20 family protein